MWVSKLVWVHSYSRSSRVEGSLVVRSAALVFWVLDTGEPMSRPNFAPLASVTVIELISDKNPADSRILSSSFCSMEGSTVNFFVPSGMPLSLAICVVKASKWRRVALSMRGSFPVLVWLLSSGALGGLQYFVSAISEGGSCATGGGRALGLCRVRCS